MATTHTAPRGRGGERRRARKGVISVDTSVRQNEVTSEAMAHRAPIARRSEQYALAKILGLWALAAVPMGLLGWVAFPLLAPDFASDPLGGV